jgi:hypothetical protein
MASEASSSAGLVSSQQPATDMWQVERRMWRLMMLRRCAIALLAVSVSAFVIVIGRPSWRHLQTAWWLGFRGFTVQWHIDRTNRHDAGTTTVAQTTRYGGWPSDFEDSELEYFYDLHRVDSLSLAECDRITEGGLASLAGLNHLRGLDLARLGHYRLAQYGLEQKVLSDACLVHLRKLPQLESLTLAGNRITDAGLPQIAGFANLKELDLVATEVSDAGLKYIQGMKNLSRVNLAATRVTKAGVTKLQDARPDLEITIETEPEIEQGVRLQRGASR